MNIRTATGEDIPAISHMMAQSFLHEELYTFLVPDPDRRERFLERFMAFRLRYGMANGQAFVTEDRQGLIVCLPPEAHMQPSDLIRYGAVSSFFRCGFASFKRLMAFNNSTDQIQAQYAPGGHWGFFPLCVAPEAQGKGYGTALVEYALQKVIPAGGACLLDTQKEKNVGFYEKFGFTVLHRSTVPGSQVPNVLMVRSGSK